MEASRCAVATAGLSSLYHRIATSMQKQQALPKQHWRQPPRRQSPQQRFPSNSLITTLDDDEDDDSDRQGNDDEMELYNGARRGLVSRRHDARSEIIVLDDDSSILPSDGCSCFQPGVSSMLHQRYIVLDEIGRGAFCSTYLAADLWAKHLVGFTRPFSIDVSYPRAADELRRRNIAAEEAVRLVAIKVMHEQHTAIGEEEASRLKQLGRANARHQAHIPSLSDVFYHTCACRSQSSPPSIQLCLVIDVLLGGQLLTFASSQAEPAIDTSAMDDSDGLSMSSNGAMDVSHGRLDQIRKVTAQILGVLCLLEKQQLIHADLKPDNVLRLAPGSDAVYVIDFGNAVPLDRVHLYHGTFEIQALAYRAPEVLAGVEIGLPIDMWAVGCLVCELWLGMPLFRGSTRSEVVRSIVSILGPFPSTTSVIRQGKDARMHHHHHRHPNYSSAFRPSPSTLASSSASSSSWAGFDRGMFADELGLIAFNGASLTPAERMGRLCQLLRSHNAQFLDFVEGLLRYNARERLTPRQALSHPFFSTLFPFSLLVEI